VSGSAARQVERCLNAVRDPRSTDSRNSPVVRILHLSADFLWPAGDGGRLRSIAQLRVLSSISEIEHIAMFCLCEEEVGAERRADLEREIPKLTVLDPVFHPVHLFRHRRYVPRVVLLRVLRGIPYLAAKWDSPAVARALRRELVGRDFDVVWINGLGMAHYLPLIRELLPRSRVVLDQHNVESDRFVEFARRQRGIRRVIADVEARAAIRYERSILRDVDAVGAISESDARGLRELAGVEARVVPHVVSIAPNVVRAPQAGRLCYAGKLSWEPNARGVDWFCREVWPIIRQRLPEATLEIAGIGLPLDASRRQITPPAWRAPGITMLGFRRDIDAVYARSAAMIAPLFGAFGISIKLLEAFRHGIPVVTTPDGAWGLPVENGRELFIESEPAAFAARVVDLATARESRARLQTAAYAYLERHHALATAQATVRELVGLGDLSPGIAAEPALHPATAPA
jgi:polysaccharide biosynthesis protein PslH